MDPGRGGRRDAAAPLTARGYDPCSDRVPAGRDATGIPVRQREAQVFSRITIGFGAALVGVSVIAALSGATTVGTASVPAVIGGLFILFGWLDRRISPPQAGRFQSRSRFPIIGAAVLVLSSARGITLVTDAHDPASTPGGTEAFLIAAAVAGVAYIIFGAWTDVAEIRRVGRARATAAPDAPGAGAPRAGATRASARPRRRARR